jgi:hypothetical protein
MRGREHRRQEAVRRRRGKSRRAGRTVWHGGQRQAVVRTELLGEGPGCDSSAGRVTGAPVVLTEGLRSETRCVGGSAPCERSSGAVETIKDKATQFGWTYTAGERMR